MNFCPKCGSALIAVKKEKDIVQKCYRCVYESEDEKKTISQIKQRKETNGDGWSEIRV